MAWRIESRDHVGRHSDPSSGKRGCSMKRTFVLTLVFVGVVAAALLFSHYAYRRGYHSALDHQKDGLVVALNTLDQIHAGNVDGATRATEEVCFRLANEFLEDEWYQTDPDVRALLPRLTKYWDTYCADRNEHTAMEKRFGSFLAARRSR